MRKVISENYYEVLGAVLHPLLIFNKFCKLQSSSLNTSAKVILLGRNSMLLAMVFNCSSEATPCKVRPDSATPIGGQLRAYG